MSENRKVSVYPATAVPTNADAFDIVPVVGDTVVTVRLRSFGLPPMDIAERLTRDFPAIDGLSLDSATVTTSHRLIIRRKRS